MMVRLVLDFNHISYTVTLFSNRYSSSLRPSPSCIGAGSPILSAVSRSFSLDFSGYPYRCSVLGSRLRIGALRCGTYPSLDSHQSPHPPLITIFPGGVSMGPSTATLASSKASLPKSPTLQTCHRSTRTFRLRGPLAEPSGRSDTLFKPVQPAIPTDR